MNQLSSDFFKRDTVIVAQELLGKIISVNGCTVRIVETEAYGRDPASHAFTRTDRSKIMFDTFGHVYVYLIYGMYECLNFTTEEKDAGAVLIRAAEPLSGIDKMKRNRSTGKLANLCSGPGKLCQALGVTRKFNGLPLGKELKVFDDGFNIGTIGTSSRVGVKDALNLQWRFYVEGNEWVSKP